ncbi:MAG TPA: H-X9-DG-CTERM domain-containing protein [Verrucomicrobiae bacterium]|nr:H-X9-DG-CTERM domain-containing protein [Verrucomicrobiae bacterium]
MFVTVVVAILAALLLPAVGRAKASAQSARCKSNLRQLQQGVQMFADENHRYPGRLRQAAQVAQPNLSLRVGAAEGVLICPSDKWSSDRWIDNDQPNPTRGAGNAGSYGYNAYGGGADTFSTNGTAINGGPDWIGLCALTESAVKNPTDMIAITGCYTEWNGTINRTPGRAGINRVLPPGVRWSEERVSRSKDEAYHRHSGKFNTAFCDGHSESIKVDVLYHDKSDEMLRRWNFDNEPHREQVRAGG